MQINWHFPEAQSALLSRGDYKCQIDDFQVIENLGFEPLGEGEHVFIFIEKNNLNTESVVRILAKKLAMKASMIGYSGLKDKYAITSQWLSFPWPIKSALPSLTDVPFSVKKIVRHNKKLKKGTHHSNQFNIIVRNIDNATLLDSNLKRIAVSGVPNYFGLQRFGHAGGNIEKALVFFRDRHKLSPFKKGLYLSATRAYLFNHYLARRVANKNWNQALAGDAFNLEGSNSFFQSSIKDDVSQRLNDMDIHPVGPLFGVGESKLSLEAREYEEIINEQFQLLVDGLIQHKVQLAYRPLRLMVRDLEWHFEENYVILTFKLVKGAFATSVLKEIVKENPDLC